MKQTFLILIWIFAVGLSAQNIQVKSQREIPLKTTKSAHYPTLNEEGNLLLFSNDGYAGLYLYNLETTEEKLISTTQNSGYDPIFSNDNSKIFFRNTTFERGRRYDALESFDLKTGKTVQMMKPSRDLRAASSYHNGALIQADNKLYKTTFGRTKASIPVYISSENLEIYVYRNGVRTKIKPISGENINYIWASLSPDNSKILFTAVGKGTYVCDLNGKIIADLGYLNAPVWFNNQFVIGMQDKDDGNFIISSKIMMVSLDGKAKKQISNQNHIAMYPTASSDSNRIVYSTLNGKLILSEISIK